MPDERFHMKVDDLSFILGLFASDGNLDKSRVRFFCSEEEKPFFENVVIPMIKRLFDCEPTLRHDIKRNYVLSINSSKVEKYFRSIFPYEGKKHINLKEPKIKFDKGSFMAGLIAGDGSIIISKNGSEQNKYPILMFVNSSKTIIDMFSIFLTKNKINHYICNRKNGAYHVAVKGSNLNNLFKLIPLMNNVQKSKLDVLKTVGYLSPHSTYKERILTLNKAPVV
jgi:hypothetical protein